MPNWHKLNIKIFKIYATLAWSVLGVLVAFKSFVRYIMRPATHKRNMDDWRYVQDDFKINRLRARAPHVDINN